MHVYSQKIEELRTENPCSARWIELIIETAGTTADVWTLLAAAGALLSTQSREVLVASQEVDQISASIKERWCQGSNCRGKAEPGGDLSPCPYREDMEGDSETLCNCCAGCINECVDSI